MTVKQSPQSFKLTAFRPGLISSLDFGDPDGVWWDITDLPMKVSSWTTLPYIHRIVNKNDTITIYHDTDLTRDLYFIPVVS